MIDRTFVLLKGLETIVWCLLQFVSLDSIACDHAGKVRIILLCLRHRDRFSKRETVQRLTLSDQLFDFVGLKDTSGQAGQTRQIKKLVDFVCNKGWLPNFWPHLENFFEKDALDIHPE